MFPATGHKPLGAHLSLTGVSHAAAGGTGAGTGRPGQRALCLLSPETQGPVAIPRAQPVRDDELSTNARGSSALAAGPFSRRTICPTVAENHRPPEPQPLARSYHRALRNLGPLAGRMGSSNSSQDSKQRLTIHQLPLSEPEGRLPTTSWTKIPKGLSPFCL